VHIGWGFLGCQQANSRPVCAHVMWDAEVMFPVGLHG
jgi:hypothetical protein